MARGGYTGEKSGKVGQTKIGVCLQQLGYGEVSDRLVCAPLWGKSVNGINAEDGEKMPCTKIGLPLPKLGLMSSLVMRCPFPM